METADSEANAPGKKPRIAVADAIMEVERQFESICFRAKKIEEVKIDKITLHNQYTFDNRNWTVAIKVWTIGTDEIFTSINPNINTAFTDVLQQFETWTLSLH